MDDIRIMDKGRVNIARVDTVKEDGKVRILDENEKRLLGKVREVYLKEQDESIPTLKAVDKRKVRAKLKMVNRILDQGSTNLIFACTDFYAHKMVLHGRSCM